MTASRTEPRPEPLDRISGCAYFGVRIPRHVRRDLEDLVARGFGGVLHTFSENDLAYYRGTLRAIVELSHELGLEVQMSPWGVGRTFGGEAESRFVTIDPDACQVLDDGRRVAAACLNHPRYRAFCREWADAALEAGADVVFWDEPHWVEPAHVGVDDPARWSCHCDHCRERFGGELPRALTADAIAFRESSLVDFLGELVAHVHERGGRNTICLLPEVEGAHGVRDWDAVAALPGLDVLATDPYWHVFRRPAGEFVAEYAELVSRTAERSGVRAELWLPAFRLARADLDDFDAALAAGRAAGIHRLWLWGYEACGHMSHLATADSELVWEHAAAAMGGGARSTERARAGRGDLDRRPTRELVELMAAEDAAVPAAVAAAADGIASAVDAIAERLARGGRLVYAGAGSSGRLARLDAVECETTFSTPPGQVVALVAGDPLPPLEQEAAEDDDEAGQADVAGISPTADDVAVIVSASGRTPYALGAARAARAAGAHTIALVAAPRSELAALTDAAIEVLVGPEFVAGSTRLKAGTAQKLVLNMLSTLAMVKLGKTYGNLMVDVAATNDKLRERVRSIVATATGTELEHADAALAAADGSAKVAIVALLAGVEPAVARERLRSADDNVRIALETS